MNRETGFTIEVGRLYWSKVRDWLKRRQLDDETVRWVESSGWFERRFDIRASRETIQIMKREFKRYMDDNEET